MCSKQNLKNFLSEISEDAKFPLFNYVSPEEYTIMIKCRVERNRKPQFYSDYATQWMNKFSNYTRTGWIVRTSFPNMKRLLYRKSYACHLSSFNKKKSEQSHTKNKQCKAKIDFKIKFINRNTIKNDDSLRDGLNLTIFISFRHTHGIRARESINLLKCSQTTDDIFFRYFSVGHSVATARSYHELTLLSNFGNDNEDYLTHSDINPTFQHVFYLHRKNKQLINHDIATTMAEKLKVFEECGGDLRYTDDYSIMVVITPFMKNVLTGHELDNIIIDSTPIKDGVSSFFFVATPLGALPIACALHSQNTEASFSQAFFSTKLLLENQTLNGFEPKKIMTNMLDEQNNALDAIFSGKTLFTSRASLVEEIWKTICDKNNKVEVKQRHDLMVSFNALLYAEDLEEAEIFYKGLENNKHIESVPKLKKILTDIWNRREEYITQEQNKVTDISIRMLKQFVLSNCNAYNGLIMIDVLLNILDHHWCQILQAHLKGRLIIETYTKFLSKARTVVSKLGVMKMNSQGYTLQSETKSGRRKNITFRPDTMCCDCFKGRKGWLCEHICAILHSTEIKTYVPEDKKTFYKALAGAEHFKVEVEIQHETNSNENPETTSNENKQLEHFFVVKEEIEENNDPLNDNEYEDNSEENYCTDDINNIKNSYTNALRALNDEFRRLNIIFKNNPNASNLKTMGRLARELSKIRPIEKVNFSNMIVETNGNASNE